jgi:hypothetical protein
MQAVYFLFIPRGLFSHSRTAGGTTTTTHETCTSAAALLAFWSGAMYLGRGAL